MKKFIQAFGLSLSLFFGVNLSFGSVYPYTYCSLNSCYLIEGPQSFFFGRLPENVIRVCRDSNMYAMTFDDGPTESWDELLDILTVHQVKATFFINGQNLNDPAHQARVLRAHQLGHQISNHSTHHLDFLKQNVQTIADELEGTRKKIVEILGGDEKVAFNARIVRPPFGYVDQRIVDAFTANGFTAVRWNSDRYDWQLERSEMAVYLKRFRQHLSFIQAQRAEGLNASMIDVNHDRARATLDSLPTMIQTLRERGYRFVTVTECIGK